MPYKIVDVDVGGTIPDLTLPPGTDGVALVVRKGTRPIGFLMDSINGRRSLSSTEVRAMVARSCATKLLQEAVRAELTAPAPPDVLPSVSFAVSIAICTKDRPLLVERVLTSVQAVARPENAGAIEILVVDNAPSDDATRQVCERFEGVRYVREPKPGLNFARNRATAAASGDIIAFLDDDVVVDRWWLEGLYAGLQENPRAAAVTGLVLPYELETHAQLLFEAQGGFRRGFDQLRYHCSSMPDDPMYPCGAGIFGAGCNMAFRRDVLLALGGFDEALDTGAPLPGGGDLDIFYRVIRGGELLVYEPRALAFHQHRRELSRLWRQYWSWGLGFMAFIEKSYGSDPEYRVRLRRIVRWWLGDQLRQHASALRGQHNLPLRLLVAEFLGGLVGLTGSYRRSRRRIEQIRLRYS